MPRFIEDAKMQHLEKQVADTAEVVREWTNSVARIETELNTANLALMRAKKQREAHALNAAMNDPAAIAAVKHARAEQQSAEQTTGDLQIALPEAKAQLAEAEKAAASARAALAMFNAEKIMRARVQAAARMDDALAQASAAYADFERLGRELQSFPDLNFGSSGNMSHWESVAGFRRIAAALPPFFLKLFPSTWTIEGARESLAESERKFWQVAPETPSEKAA
jgi:hypothetical protein